MADELNTPEREEFYASIKKRQNMVRYTFSVTVEMDRNQMKADPEATVSDSLKVGGMKVVRVKQLGGETP